MVQRLTHSRVRDFGATLLILVAGGGLLWHLLACTDSPMSFSPDSKNLAFVSLEPYSQDDILVAGTHASRLMVVAQDERPRVIESTVDNLLAGPVYSPDGKRLCYLRIPLLSAEKCAALNARVEDRKKAKEPEEFRWLALPTPPPKVDDASLPVMEKLGAWFEDHRDKVILPVTLVERDMATDAVLTEMCFDLPLGEKPAEDVWTLYLFARLQYSPDGKSIYFNPGGNALAVADLAAHSWRILAIGPALAALSPDGKTIAGMQEASVCFIQTDGTRTVYCRLDTGSISLGGFCWVDEHTIAVMIADKDQKQILMQMVRSDGTLGKKTPLSLPKEVETKNIAGVEWAVSREGSYMVLVAEERVFFMKADGTVVKDWKGGEKEVLAQPTFSPDSQRVAFKYLSESADSGGRANAIVFFTPQGKELSHVEVPPIAPGTTRPASAPAAK